MIRLALLLCLLAAPGGEGPTSGAVTTTLDAAVLKGLLNPSGPAVAPMPIEAADLRANTGKAGDETFLSLPSPWRNRLDHPSADRFHLLLVDGIKLDKPKAGVEIRIFVGGGESDRFVASRYKLGDSELGGVNLVSNLTTTLKRIDSPVGRYLSVRVCAFDGGQEVGVRFKWAEILFRTTTADGAPDDGEGITAVYPEDKP